MSALTKEELRELISEALLQESKEEALEKTAYFYRLWAHYISTLMMNLEPIDDEDLVRSFAALKVGFVELAKYLISKDADIETIEKV
jgi:hypothetical protein